MLTAKNYFAQFEKSFIGLVRKGHIYSGTEYDIELLKTFKKSLKGTVHFSVPKNGKIFDDGFKGIINREIRLPYPAISLEYDTNDVELVNKAIILAFEHTKEDFLNTLDESSRAQAFDVIKKFNGEIVIHVIAAGVSPDGWIILPISWVLPTQWDKEHDIDNVKLKLSEDVTSYGGFVKFIPNMFEDLIKRYSHEWVKQVYELNIIDQVKVLLEFIEALSCSNVKMENIQNEDKKLNKSRV